MKKLLIPFFVLATLTACGVDGAPQRPAEEAEEVTGFSGDAYIGISKSAV